ncbi:unnamed protein product [Darwinula stevensoni]|uniref:CUB domain-containing protein n=1 Tax=Darwinula stevensoni TaxID=69355 RepID=A0A7R9A0F4_9CRUS|nr:unnamed protein product [Darwinula stevensoni]CAG0885481.1 unnamed protein product [Darwinula stevensoni]
MSGCHAHVRGLMDLAQTCELGRGAALDSRAALVDASPNRQDGSNEARWSRAMAANSTETFQSPNYPSNYNNNYYVEWCYTCPNQLTLSCPDIRIQWSFFCWKDALMVSGNGDWSYCGQTSLTYTVPAGRMLSVAFRTNFLITARGFQCTVTCP